MEEAAIEYHDDDYFDVNIRSEPDAFITPSPEGTPDERRTLSHVLKLGHLHIDTGIHAGFGYSEGILDAYRPEMTANPLKNPATARVFAHFVHVTGPTLSSHSRRPPPSKAPTERGDTPFSERGLWTHVIPLAAIQDQGLLQAMLALSSLHIAKLTGASTTPSFKHYAYALKRVHHSVGRSARRNSVPVVGASLLLALYELWCAEHVKWSSHLAGAGQLLVETDFVHMQKQTRKLRLERATERRQNYPTFRRARMAQRELPPNLKTKIRQFRDLDQVPDVDAQIVSIMAGKIVNYDDYGHILNDHDTATGDHADVDIPAFEARKDLFWAFAKQDMIGSVVSGNPLL